MQKSMNLFCAHIVHLITRFVAINSNQAIGRVQEWAPVNKLDLHHVSQMDQIKERTHPPMKMTHLMWYCRNTGSALLYIILSILSMMLAKRTVNTVCTIARSKFLPEGKLNYLLILRKDISKEVCLERMTGFALFLDKFKPILLVGCQELDTS